MHNIMHNNYYYDEFTLSFVHIQTVQVHNDSSGPSFGNNTSDSDSKNSIIIVTAVTVSVISFVLLVLIISCGVVLSVLLRSGSSKDASTDESHTQSTSYPYYENITLPRVIYQDQEFELKDNIAYGPLPLSAGASH